MDTHIDADVVRALAQEVRELRGEVARLSAQAVPPPPNSSQSRADTDESHGEHERAGRRVSRRGMLLGAAGAAAAGAVVLTTGALPAAADNNGEPWTLGDVTNQATNVTGLTTSGIGAALYVDNPSANDASAAILGVNHGATVSGYGGSGAVTGVSTGENSTGVSGVSDGLQSVGVSGQASTGGLFTGTVVGGHGNSTTAGATGLLGSSDDGIGVQGTSANGTAGQFTSDHAALNLSGSALRGSPLVDGQPHAVGDLVVDAFADLWYCCVAGTPGTWRKLSGIDSSGAFHALASPMRMYDSRPGFATQGGPQTRLTANTARVVYVNPALKASRDGMSAVMLTVMLVNTAPGNGNLTIWPNLTAKPATNNMVWGGTAGRFSSLTVVPVASSQGGLNFVSSLATDLVVDVVGYWR